MEEKHTPGPWEVTPAHQTSGWGTCVGGARNIIARLTGRDKAVKEANARRIVAAVNACEGISTEALEAGAVGGLVAVVEELLESAAYWSEYDVPLGIVDRMRTALDKAKGATR